LKNNFDDDRCVFFSKAGGVFALFLLGFIFVCSVSTMFPPTRYLQILRFHTQTNTFLCHAPWMSLCLLPVSCQAPAVNPTSIRRVNKGFVPTSPPLKQPSFYSGRGAKVEGYKICCDKISKKEIDHFLNHIFKDGDLFITDFVQGLNNCCRIYAMFMTKKAIN